MIGVLLHSFLGIQRAIDKWTAIKYKAPNYTIFLANSNVRRQFIYGLAQVGMVILGVAAMTIEEPMPGPSNVARGIVSTVILAVEVLLIINALWDNIDRARLLAMIGGRRATDNS